MEELIRLLKAIYPLSVELEERLRQIIKPYFFKKGEFLLNIGEVANEILFLRQGMVMSKSNVDGKLVVNWFMKEGDIVIGVLSFFRQIESVEAIEALEDCECWGISHAELEKLCKEFIEFGTHRWMITQEYYCRSIERMNALKGRNQQGKYNYLMATAPELVARVSNELMAAYLNMSKRSYEYAREGFRSNSV